MAGLVRYLRQGVGQEWRAELEATEFEIHQDRLRRRTLLDITKMLLHRGDRLTMRTGQLQLTGEVVGGAGIVSPSTPSISAPTPVLIGSPYA